MKKQSPLNSDNKVKPYHFFNGHKFLMAFICVIVVIMLIAVFQDFLQSKRNNSLFFFSESILFKTFWLLFLPILALIKKLLSNKKYHTYMAMGLIIVIATMAHMVLTSLTVWGLSEIFRDQSYGVIKVLTYTLANDLVKILLVYGVFIYGLRYVMKHPHNRSFNALSDVKNRDAVMLDSKQAKNTYNDSIQSSNYLFINSGKNNTRIDLNDILYIQSATPYVSIHLKDKEYLESSTLKSIINSLDERFIRIHRSSIVNLDKVRSYQSRLNGDYDVLLDDGTKIRLSRNFVKAFKSRYVSTPQLKT